MVKLMRSILLLSVLVLPALPGSANEGDWEYQVVILPGVTAGRTLEKQAGGFTVDTRRTKILNELAAQGWELVAVTGAPLADHSVYLRRKLNK
jgi:Domain of unknown function (DUF4177)